MIRKLLLAMLLFPAWGLGQHTYYIANSGSDSNTAAQAQSKSTPWAHSPGMSSCSGNCASYTPVAGDRFILKGGDTWTASDVRMAWHWSGTSSARIYIGGGGDQTWFSGSSWRRPIWTCSGTSTCGGGYWISGQQYTTLDNIEVTGWHTSADGGGDMFYAFAPNQEFSHLYIHGWSHATSGDGDNGQIFGWGGADVHGCSAHDNVIDGSDTTMDMLAAFIGNIPISYNNIVRYVSNGYEAAGDNWHDNIVGPIGKSFSPGAHQNAMFHFSPAYATSVLLYNNVIANNIGSICADVCGGIVKLWVNGNATTTAQVYAFNLLMYNNATSNFINFGAHNPGNYGTLNLFNNTIECGADSATQQCINDAAADPGRIETLVSQNNHWISDQSPAISCIVFHCSSSHDVLQSVATASAQGYRSSQVPPFQPSSNAGATVATGLNETGTYCAAVAMVDSAAGTACLKSSSTACQYNTSTHTPVCPGFTPVTRPSAWDVGDYQFNGGGGGTPIASISPGSVDFGTVTAGNTSSPSTVTLTNTGSATLSVTSVTLSGANAADFAISSVNCNGANLSPSGTCFAAVTFSPSLTGAESANLVFTDNAGSSPQNIPLTGTGGAASGPVANLSPSSLNFGTINVGSSSSSQDITLQNTGGATLNLSSITITGANAGDFSKTTTCGGTLASTASCTVSVTFSPSANGARSASMQFTDDAPGSPQSVAVSGTGVLFNTPYGLNVDIPAVTPHYTTLSWYAPTGGAGNINYAYNIYRGLTSGGESGTPLNLSPVDAGCVDTSSCTYTDAPVTVGITYYYVVKALIGGSTLTGASNEVAAQITPVGPTDVTGTPQ